MWLWGHLPEDKVWPCLAAQTPLPRFPPLSDEDSSSTCVWDEIDVCKGLCGCIVSTAYQLGHPLKVGPKALLPGAIMNV